LSYLLDASTLLPLLIDYGEKLLSIDVKAKLYMLDLTLYEVGNTLWKLVALQSTLELEDAKDILYALKSLIRRDTIKVMMFEEINMERVLQLAASEKLTFYDASYIAASEAVKATLATEDKDLKEKAGKYIDVIGYSDLRGRL